MAAASTTIERRDVAVNGTRLALLEKGRGQPIVLLHGFPDNAWTWSRQIDPLADAGHRVIAPFLPGYPPSGMPPGGVIEIAEVVDLLASLLEEEGQGPLPVIGHDWGATLTYSLAALRPDALSSGIAIAAAHPARMSGTLADPRLTQYAFHHWLFQLPGPAEAALRANDLSLVSYLWRHWSPGLNDAEHVDQVIRRTLAAPGAIENALAYYWAMFRAMTSGSLEFPQTTVPMLTIFGGDDPMRALAEGQDHLFAKGYAAVNIPGCGHFPHREKPERVTRLILEWLTQQDVESR